MVQLPLFPKSLCHFHFLLCSMSFLVSIEQPLLFFGSLHHLHFLLCSMLLFVLLMKQPLFLWNLQHLHFSVVFYILCHCVFHIPLFKVCVFFHHHFVSFVFWISKCFCVLLARSHCKLVHHHHCEVNKSCPICIMFEILIQAQDLLIIRLN